MIARDDMFKANLSTKFAPLGHSQLRTIGVVYSPLPRGIAQYGLVQQCRIRYLAAVENSGDGPGP